jgi:thiol-disulfide isomerase/thioredoxin
MDGMGSADPKAGLVKPASWLAVAGLLAMAAACGRAPRASTRPPKAGSPAVVRVSARDIHTLVEKASGHVVLVNLWATWCEPCREEFPELLRLRRELGGEGLDVVLVSADFDGQLPQVRTFLAEQGVDFTTYFKAESDMPFINGLDPAWSGSLPATFVYDRAGRLREFWEGKVSYGEFVAKVKTLLGS